jgi:hypothetical protein
MCDDCMRTRYNMQMTLCDCSRCTCDSEWWESVELNDNHIPYVLQHQPNDNSCICYDCVMNFIVNSTDVKG